MCIAVPYSSHVALMSGISFRLQWFLLWHFFHYLSVVLPHFFQKVCLDHASWLFQSHATRNYLILKEVLEQDASKTYEFQSNAFMWNVRSKHRTQLASKWMRLSLASIVLHCNNVPCSLFIFFVKPNLNNVPCILSPDFNVMAMEHVMLDWHKIVHERDHDIIIIFPPTYSFNFTHMSK